MDGRFGIAAQFAPSPHNAFLDPAWRWRAANWLFEHGRRPTQHHDPATWAAWKFLQARPHSDTGSQKKAVDWALDDVAQAYALYSDPVLRRWELEGRLLGDQNNAEIGRLCGLSEAAVHTYHALFFDVRSRLRASIYINHVVIRWSEDPPPPTDDYDRLCKVFGYHGGPLALDAYLDCLRAPPIVPDSLGHLDCGALRLLRDKLRMQLTVFVLTTPASAKPFSFWQNVQRLMTPPEDNAAAPGDDAIAGLHAAIANLHDVAKELAAVQRAAA